jgi:hypothetical protein
MRATNALSRTPETAASPRRFHQCWSRVAAVCGLLVFLQPPTAHAQPQELVSSGVSSVVRDTPNLVDSTLFWTTAPTCSNAAGDELKPALINRASLFVSRPRAIFSFNPPRPVATCNPYRLLSNVATDGSFLYFVDNQGPAGHAVLWRRPPLANAEDASQLLVDLGAGLTNAELLVFGNYVFAILHRPNTFDVIVEYLKTGEFLNGNVEFAGPDELSNMQYDGRYLYWINGGALRRNDTTNGAKVTSVTGPISTYYLEGYDNQCSPLGCEEYSRVLFAQGNQLFEIDTIGGGALPQYTSVNPNAQILSITRDGIHYYFIERRAVGGGFDREDRFYRLGVGSTVPALIYGPVNNGGPGFDSFTTDSTWLYFRDRAAQKLLRLANDAAAIPIYDVAARYIEVTQGLQNYDNALRLIEGKRTVVRFFVKSNSATDVPGVTASLVGQNQQGFLGTLEPINGKGKLLTVVAGFQRDRLDQSFQFELPRNWTTGGNLSLTATVNPFGRVVEDNAADNSFSLGPIVFTPSPRLHVDYVNFVYAANGTFYSSPAAEVAASMNRMRRLYPLGQPLGGFVGPGLFLTQSNIGDLNLGRHVMRTDPDCIKRYEKAEDRNLCASDYVHGQIAAMRRSGQIRAETVSYATIAQLPDPPGLSYFTRGYANGQVGSGPSTDANYGPHEIGHVLGRSHPTAASAICGHSASDDNYPYVRSLIDDRSNRQIAYAGLDFGDASGTMTFLDANSNYDTMSYCSPNWISDYTVNGMYDFLAKNPFGGGAARAVAGPVVGDWLMVTGTLDLPSHTGGFVLVERTDSLMDASPPVAGGFTLELRDGAGTLLASHGFTPTLIEEQPGRVAFDVVVPFVDGTAELRAIEDATARTLATRMVSPNAPLVSDVQLPNAPDPVNGMVSVTWNASDPDGDTLHFDVLASRDGGQTYHPIQLGVEAAAVDLDTSLLGGGTNRLRIVASDGVQTAHADSAPFSVPPRPPVLMIASPMDEFRADWGQLVSFEAEISDRQDEFIPDPQILWSNEYGMLGTGRLFQTDQLQVGTNVVTVTARNSLGAEGKASITVVIGDPLTPLDATLSVAPQMVAWHIANDETAARVAQLDVENAGAGSLNFDVTSDAGWLRVDSELALSGASAPRTFIVSADPTLVPPGTTSRAQLTFQNIANPSDVTVVPVELSRGNVFDRTGAEPAAACLGDCNGSQTVTVDELITGINIALGTTPVDACSSFDTNADRAVTINEVVAAVKRALKGCAAT